MRRKSCQGRKCGGAGSRGCGVRMKGKDTENLLVLQRVETRLMEILGAVREVVKGLDRLGRG